jgi:REP-associated tyrosine transposase
VPINEKYTAVFECEKIYHIYNKTNNKELLFRSDENHYYFLRRYSHFISPIADTYAWNLLPNHFHFIIKIKQQSQILSWLATLPADTITITEKHFLEDLDVNRLTEMTFKRLFTSYAMAYNKMYQRSGNLFYRTFKRIEILKESDFTHSIVYVHANALKHKLVREFTSHPWTSFHSIISNKPTNLLRDEVIDWFGSKEKFVKVHKEMSGYYYGFPGGMEDD